MIRLARLEDLTRINSIYESAKKYMRLTGNQCQWTGNYPSIEILTNDIKNRHLYVCYDESIIYGVFVFYLGGDPTYNYIEGRWLNCEDYGTIHRIASNGTRKGVFNEVLVFCKSKTNNIRIDTHHDNIVMQNKLNSFGFKQCGIIYLNDGSPRLAYQFIKNKR